jgi:uncharacterized membrane protein YfcA
MHILSYVLIGLAAFGAGFVNALAGGGTLITFPLLTALGIPAVAANVTNTVALCPGYLGATLAQRELLTDQKKRLWLYLPAGALGGVIGALLLINSSERLFTAIIPWLILTASLLLAVGEPIKKWLASHQGVKSTSSGETFISIPVALASVYGGYFGAGLSVIILSVLGISLRDTLTRLNALKQAVAFATNIAAAVVFVFSGQVVWLVAGIMAVFAIAGGTAGGRLAGKVNPSVLRWIIVCIGLLVSVYYFIKTY